MRRHAPQRGTRLLFVLPIALSLISPPALAGEVKSSSDLLEKAKLRAAVYMRGLKQIRAETIRGGTIDPARREEAVSAWRRIAGIPSELDRLRAAARRTGRKAARSDADGAADEIARIAATVRRLDARYRPILGEPPALAPPPSAARSSPVHGGPAGNGGAYFLSGQVTAGGGSAAFRPLEQPGGEQDAGTLEFRVRGGMRPDEKTNLALGLARSRRVEQLAVTNTEVTARAERAMTDRLQATAEAGYRGYGEDDADARDYGEARLKASGRYALSTPSSLEAAYGYDRRRHGQTSAADFSSHRLDAAFRHRTDGLRLESTLSVQRRSAGAVGGSFTRREPAVVFEIQRAGGAPTGARSERARRRSPTGASAPTRPWISPTSSGTAPIGSAALGSRAGSSIWPGDTS